MPRYTVEDLEQLPDDGNRYELLDGVLLVTPSPSFAHQLIASRIHGAFLTGVQAPGHGYVLGPGVVVQHPKTQLQPDILVIPSRFSPKADWKNLTEHWLAVEVLSRSSRTYDRKFKRDAYLALGVSEVWLVDGREKSVEISRALGYSEMRTDTLEWVAPVQGVRVVIELEDLFLGV
ncbi:MAG: Uma2 family endonuclease [Gemmatimonadaceae bacterium]|nr:Uma2 family endonuclease [Gemmatimonadaceae bacterium]